jgi:hypothetical protein
MAAGTDHVAFTYGDLGDLLQTYRRLKTAGIEPYWCINHGPTISLYYKDPDGSRIELQVDTMPSSEAIDAWMRSGDFAANPIGIVFEPDELAARYESGEPRRRAATRGARNGGSRLDASTPAIMRRRAAGSIARS